MLRNRRLVLVLAGSLLATSMAIAQVPTFNMTKFGQAGMKFLDIGTSARAEGMGGAVTTMDMGAASMFYNPAGLAGPSGTHGDVWAGRTNWAADIALNSFAASYKTPWVTVGVSGLSVDYGDIAGRRMTESGAIEETGNVDVSSTALGIGVAKAVTDKFQVGVVGRYVSEDLDLSEGASENVLTFDAGTLYHTGLAGSVLSMSVRNFSRQAKHQDLGYDLPMAFRIGVAMDVLDLVQGLGDQHSLMVAVDALHPRDRAEEAILGVEYNFMNLVSLRAASRVGRDYTGSDAKHPTAVSVASLGAGLHYQVGPTSVGANYAWQNVGSLLGAVHRFDVQIGL